MKAKGWKRLLCVCLAFGVLLCHLPAAMAAPDAHNAVYFDDNFGGGLIPSGWELDDTGGKIWATDGALHLERTENTEHETGMRRYINPDRTSIDGKFVLEIEAVQNKPALTQFFIYGITGITTSLRYENSGKVGITCRDSDDTDVTSTYNTDVYSNGSVIKLRIEINTKTRMLNVYEGDEQKHIVVNKYTRGGNATQLYNFYFWNQAGDMSHFELRKFKLSDSEVLLSDQEALESAADQLTFERLSAETSDDVTQDLYLPSKGVYDTDIAWDTSDSAVLDATGKVTPPADSEHDTPVTLTAQLSLNGLTLTKTFDLTVVRQLDDLGIVNRIYDYLEFSMISPDDINTVSHNLTLIDHMYGADIIWVSDKPEYISAEGAVTRPPASAGDVQVVLTAHILKGSQWRKKDFVVTVSNLSSFTDPMQMSDEDFFGVWSESRGEWTTVGKLNYTYAPALAEVEEQVKSGDYSAAKQSLLEYYQKKAVEDIKYQPSARNSEDAKLLADDIYTHGVNSFLGEFYLPTSYRQISVNLPVSRLTKASYVSFLLMGRLKDDGVAEFNSKQSGENAPELELTINGNKRTFPVLQDAYIRAGSHGDEAYGESDRNKIEVKDSGAPFDDESRRGLLMFDLRSVLESDSVTTATLKLYGRSVAAAPKRIMIMSEGDVAWDENTVCWNSITGKVYSWQGINGGTDWNAPVGAERQWDYMIARFMSLGALANEYLYTNDELYAYHTIRVFLDFIYDKGTALCAVGYGDGIGGYPRTLDCGIRVGRSMPIYYAVVASQSMDKEANTAILKQYWMNGEFLKKDSNFSHEGNWGGSETGGLFNLALYFPEFSDAAGEAEDTTKWEGLAISRITRMMKELLYEDGSYVEPTSFYTEGQFNTNAGYKTLADQFGRQLGEEFDEALLGMAYYIMQMYTPAGDGIVYGDTDPSTRNSSKMQNMVKWYDDSVLDYIATFGERGTKPDYTSQIYPDSRMVFMRGGWNKNAPYLFVNAKGGVGGWSHAHGDDCAVTVAAYGKSLLIDPGRYHYVGTDPDRRWIISTAAHNTIEINGKTQELAKQLGEVEEWVTNDSFDFVKISTPNNPGFKHTRNILFVKPGYWIVSDYVTNPDATKQNTYRQMWHTLPNANLALDGVSKSFYTDFMEGANISVVPADPDALTASLEEGLYSPSGSAIMPAAYGQYMKNTKGNVVFDTILYPTPENKNEKVGVMRLPLDVPETQATALEITIVDEQQQSAASKGYYYLTQDEAFKAPRAFGEFKTDGAMAYVQYSTAGRMKDLYLRDGSFLQRNGQTLIEGANIKDVGVLWQAKELHINSSDSGLALASLKIQSDVTIEKAYFNEQPVTFLQADNGMITFDSSAVLPPEKTEGSGNSAPSGGGGGGGGKTPGGSVVTPGNPVVVPPGPSTPPTVEPTPEGFDDIKNHWAQKEIEALAERGIVKGADETSFLPEQTITRAESAAILVRALKLPITEYHNAFADVHDSDWYAASVQAAYEYGMIDGVGDGNFEPNAPVTREQVAKLFVFALEKASGLPIEADGLSFTDRGDVSSWAVESVGKAVASGVVKGLEDGSFAPHKQTSRAEFAVMLYRMLTQLDETMDRGGNVNE